MTRRNINQRNLLESDWKFTPDSGFQFLARRVALKFVIIADDGGGGSSGISSNPMEGGGGAVDNVEYKTEQDSKVAAVAVEEEA